MRRIGLVGAALVVAMLGPGMSAHAAAATADVDKDRMPDRWERAHGLRVGVNDARRDPDHDGLTNYFEYRVDRLAGLVSHPKVADSDHDGVSDGNEDLDHDGLSNEDEATLGTRLFDRDSDNDGVSDGREDADHDGLDNAFELGAVDGQDDEDGDGIAEGRDDDDHDGVSNTGEFNPGRGDSDHDGVRDGREDEDGDGLDNTEEEQLGEDPSDADSDDDGDEDGEETAGTIVAFDADTRLLTLQPPGEAELSATVAEDVELEWDEAGDGPQACADAEDPTLADLMPGRVVSDLEVEDEDGSEVVTEIELVCPTDDS